MSCPPIQEKLIRITMCAYRQKDLSEEEFNAYWANVHGPLAGKWLKRCGIVKYVQCHTSPEYRKLAQDLSQSPGAHKVFDWDAIGDFYVRDYQDFVNAFKDPEYLAVIRPDEAKFVDINSMIVTVGTDFVVLEEGEMVKDHAKTF